MCVHVINEAFAASPLTGQTFPKRAGKSGKIHRENGHGGGVGICWGFT